MYKNARAVNIQHQRFWLLPEKAIYWQKRKTLLVADPHIGKSGHFRKHGIAVPKEVNLSTLQSLAKIIEQTSAQHLVILGDLFHSDLNSEWQQFIKWRKQFNKLEVTLVIGNHDILKKEKYHSGIINLFKKMTMGPFLLVHDLANNSDNDHYILSGHIHPAVKLKGKGRQALKLPCFYFNQYYGILPAFGEFTGSHIIEPDVKDRIFLITDSQILSASELRS
jgi:DNA ligase-associated metallophosphoesterase